MVKAVQVQAQGSTPGSPLNTNIMEKIGKIAVISLIVGVGLLLLDLLACFVALANMESIGSLPEYQMVVGGIIITACVCLAFSVLLGIFYAIGRYLENQ